MRKARTFISFHKVGTDTLLTCLSCFHLQLEILFYYHASQPAIYRRQRTCLRQPLYFSHADFLQRHFAD